MNHCFILIISERRHHHHGIQMSDGKNIGIIIYEKEMPVIFRNITYAVSGKFVLIQTNDIGDINKYSLKDAGKRIGYFERFLVLTFIITGYHEAIGFLLAAKSIFRFGELRDKNEIKFTEYVLVGTLASFTMAIINGVVLMKGCIIKMGR